MGDNPDIPQSFSRKDIEKLYNCNERTAQRLIKSWLDHKQVRLAHKINRRPHYVKIENLYSEYKKSFVDSYIPNKTYFLSKAERKSLKEIATLNSHVDFETYSIRLYERIIVDLSWASSKLEGNTFSLLDTERLILNNETIEGKTAIEIQMILNHKEAIKFITYNIKKIQIDAITIKSIHALLAENLLSNLSSIGNLRKIPVGISGTNYTPLNIPQLLETEFEIFIKKAFEIQDPFEQALFILIFIPYLQPFEDMNKRTSRITCNVPLLKNKLIPISFKNIIADEYSMALKDIYEKTLPTKMKELFINSVLYSSEEYKKIVSVMSVPKKGLIKYRSIIKKYIHDCVVNNIKPNLNSLAEIEEKDRTEILEHIKNELKHLHEGQLVRFDLLPSQFNKWKKLRY